ncbi:hypothetical protein I6E17_08690 [Fusobacterium perfoetens]|jgi:hypothetical protein|uniref:hypothetical protein n=1 Tax=Fusobacterium perfoetens TaxID=852 RepID=UPI001F16A2CE|nr:hypothetical protein [Fusobacterium perfoetens]MCF2626229.1 hypothetical protein [Fusobacterium perfoetens]
MKEELVEVQKKIGQEFLLKIDTYKRNNHLSYTDIADIVGIDKFYFANLRNKIKKNKTVPTDKVIKKFSKIITF